jgi:hypothetical protein
MTAPEQLPLLPTTAEPLDANTRSELRDGLLALAASRPSRKAIWEALRAADATDVSLRRFYDRVRAAGLPGALEELIVPARVAAIRALLARPPAARPRVAVSTLANQFYCEMQVHLETLFDVRVVSREMTAGATAHARFEAEAEPISDVEVARRMAAGEAMGLVEMPLDAELDGVRVVGRADRVQLQGTEARLVLEYKFSGRRELYPSYVAQVHAYGLLLAARGLQTTSLLHAVAVLPRGAAAGEGVADRIAGDALALASAAPWEAAPGVSGTDGDAAAARGADPLDALSVRSATGGDYGLFVFQHGAARARQTVSWALSYWRGERAPVPTTSPAKCRACPHNAAALCAAARAAPDGRFRARQGEARAGKRQLVLLTPAR